MRTWRPTSSVAVVKQRSVPKVNMPASKPPHRLRAAALVSCTPPIPSPSSSPDCRHGVEPVVEEDHPPALVDHCHLTRLERAVPGTSDRVGLGEAERAPALDAHAPCSHPATYSKTLTTTWDAQGKTKHTSIAIALPGPRCPCYLRDPNPQRVYRHQARPPCRLLPYHDAGDSPMSGSTSELSTAA